MLVVNGVIHLIHLQLYTHCRSIWLVSNIHKKYTCISKNHVFSKQVILKLTIKYKSTSFEYTSCVYSKLVNLYDSDISSQNILFCDRIRGKYTFILGYAITVCVINLRALKHPFTVQNLSISKNKQTL